MPIVRPALSEGISKTYSIKWNPAEMSDIRQLPVRTSIVGTWKDSDGISRVEFEVTDRGGILEVQAIDIEDGECLDIRDTKWDGKRLSFISVTRSTGRLVEHVFEALSKTSIRHDFVIRDSEVWQRK